MLLVLVVHIAVVLCLGVADGMDCPCNIGTCELPFPVSFALSGMVSHYVHL